MFDKICENQAQQQLAEYPTMSPPSLFLHQNTLKIPILVVKCGEKLSKTSAKLKPI